MSIRLGIDIGGTFTDAVAAGDVIIALDEATVRRAARALCEAGVQAAAA